MNAEKQMIKQSVSAVLQRNGVFMTTHGAVGPEDVDKRILAGQTRQQAIAAIAAKVANREVV